MSQAGVAFLPDRRLLSPRLTLREHLAAFEQARHEVLDPGPAASLDVEDLLDSRSFRMSGGEQRRAEIWLSVMTGTSCLIADEPEEGGGAGGGMPGGMPDMGGMGGMM